jgi:biopolymer transport protein ExbB/TolQ
MISEAGQDGCELGLVRLKAVDAVERTLPLIAREDLFQRTPHAAVTMRLHVAQLARELALWCEAARRIGVGHISHVEFRSACQSYRRFTQVFFATTATLNLAIERCDEPARSELADLLDTALSVLATLGAVEQTGF